jgi:hypothetical protein
MNLNRPDARVRPGASREGAMFWLTPQGRAVILGGMAGAIIRLGGRGWPGGDENLLDHYFV